MNRAIFLIVLSSFAVVVWAQERMTAPGATGMNSDVNPLNLRPTDAQYLLNVNVSSNPGILYKRYGHVAYDTNARAISAVAALYDEITKWKCAIGVGHAGDISVGGFLQIKADSTYDTIDSSFSLLDSTVGLFWHTAKYQAELIDSIPSWWTEYDGGHDFTRSNVGLIHANRNSPPAVLTPLSSATFMDSILDSVMTDTTIIVDTFWSYCKWCPAGEQYDTTIDTIGINDATTKYWSVNTISDSTYFGPRVRPLSPESPGTPRAFAINDVTGGNLTGIFQYAIAFKIPNGERDNPGDTLGLLADFVGQMGDPTNVVRVDAGIVVLTNLPIYPLYDTADVDSTPAVIYRKRVDEQGEFRALDSLIYLIGDTVIYVDNNANDLSHNTTSPAYGFLFPKPGKPGPVTIDTSTNLDVDSAWTRVSRYYFAYSYVDTLLGLESPIGPSVNVVSPDTTPPDTIAIGFIRIPYVGDWDAVRLYRSVPDFVSDSFYAVRDIPIPNSTSAGDWSGVLYVPVGTIADTSLVISGGVVDETGYTITRPPFISPLTSTFTDIEFWDDRLWGIGDPEFPSRLYRTDDEGFSSWNAITYYSMDEDDNDILIALEKISVGSADALLAFKRRKTFIVHGSTPADVEFVDGRLWSSYESGGSLTIATLTNSVGAISKDLVIKHRDAVYVVTNDLEVVRFTGTRPDTISKYVGNVLRDIMTDTVGAAIPYGKGDRQQMACISYSAADVNAKVMISDNEVIYMNQNSGNGMAWNVENETWSLVKYTFPERPRGTFKYDTISTIDLFGNNNDLFYFDRLAKPFYLKTWGVYRDTGGSAVGGYKLTYRSPEYGDGMHQWWMRSLQFGYDADSGTVPTSLTCRVINEEGDTIATSTYTASAGGVKDATVGFGRHAAKSLCFEITTGTDTNFVAIYDIRTDLVKVGRKRIK